MDVGASESRSGNKSGDRSMRMKRYISECLMRAMEIDRVRALRMINSYRSKWLDVMESRDVNEMETLDEYLVFRNLNGGMEAFWSMVTFGMAVDISAADMNQLRPMFQAAESALVLTNDYWSWDREWRHAQRTQNPRIVNAIHLFMRAKGMSLEEARETVRQRILAYEADYLRAKEEFYKLNPHIPLHVKRYIEVCGVIVAGNHYCDESTSLAEYASEEGVETTSGPCSSSYASPKSSSVMTPSLSETFGFMMVHDEKPARASDRALLAPCDYIRSMPSKGLRSLMVEALDQWLLVDDSSLEQIKAIIDLLHNSSLILDDIEDNSALRRGFPATHMVFGQAQSINAANFMFVRAVQLTQTLESPECLETLLDELECLFTGQSWDLYWKFHLQVPTEEEYFEMIDSKTGAMFRLLARLMYQKSHVIAASNSHRTISPCETLRLLDKMCRLFGRFFQIRDDFMNLNSTEYSDQKGFCEDLDEGKMSYPLIMVMRQNPERKDQIIGIFRQQAANSSRANMTEPARLSYETKRFILGIIKKSKVMHQTLEKIRELESAAEDSIGELEGAFGETNPVMRILLGRLSVRDVVLT
ncbi:geranylgeranyl pyrophosphate synthase [Colletotrichum karsti]|uniref:Geranylgeranyl pyrophosphate synthase n=1 Tax=Colletotrichum karsti TaxID=1095194 RepID=A0A9P6HXP5_9PEZI|nr:geranylgeranyl pyrophosphate synthase [Colletotrichum karsti]KAF9873147.1 geranylgeranyl pyrophosphate synthase [Colletotrichum karsti]